MCLEGDLIRERFGMPGLPAVFSRAWMVWCLAEQGAFAEGREKERPLLEEYIARSHFPSGEP